MAAPFVILWKELQRSQPDISVVVIMGGVSLAVVIAVGDQIWEALR